MNWDILNICEDNWAHLEILDRLHEEGIDCYFVDMWFDDIVIIIGYREQHAYGGYEIANALNIPQEIIYYDSEHSFVFINLYQLKAIRANVDGKIKEIFGD